jgi:hypothetical protein
VRRKNPCIVCSGRGALAKTGTEWLGLLDVAVLRLEALYGGFAGEPLDDNRPEYVFVARR